MKLDRESYPGNPETARRIQDLISVVTGEPLPRSVREPDRFANRLRESEANR